jgi:tetratricopeptide (TPR) repeat protein
MEERDYLKKKIDKLARVMAKMLADLLALKNQGRIAEAIEITNKALKNEITLNVDDLLAIEPGSLIKSLQMKNNFDVEHLEHLANILFVMADDLWENDPENKKSDDLYDRCLRLYEYLNETDSTYSLERHLRIETIKARIDIL